MPDKRHHRGRHPDDAKLFAPDRWDDLRSAVADLSWLLSRNYAQPSALKVVGDRYELDARQRMAVMRASCSDEAKTRRLEHEVPGDAVPNTPILIDGYNVLTTIEAALAGGVLLHCRDGTIRDIASIHGTYRKVEETVPALAILVRCLRKLHVGDTTWLLDSPVSNSGRLKAIMLDTFGKDDCTSWSVEMVPNPDSVLSDSDQIVATADSVILDRCQRWFNLAAAGIAQVAKPNLIDLRA